MSNVHTSSFVRYERFVKLTVVRDHQWGIKLSLSLPLPYQNMGHARSQGLAVRWGHNTERWGHNTEKWGHNTVRWGHNTERWGHNTERWGHNTERWGHSALKIS